MNIPLSVNGRESLKKVLPVVALAVAMLLVAGFVYLSAVKSVEAAKPSDYGLKEGDTISAAGSNDPDVYIVNDWGYKRLFLNPAIFGFYGHLGGFAKVKSVTPATRDAFPTSGLFRNCETNDEKVYGVETTGEDTGILHWVNTSGAQAVADDPNFFKKVFCINTNEFNWYAKGTNYTSVNQVPNYVRTPGPTPVPSGALSAYLAPGNPSAQTITKNAQGVEMLRVRLSGSGTVSSMTFKRGGAGAVGDISNAYVYDGATRLVSGKSLSSATGEVTFINLNISVSGTKDVSFVADMAGTAGNVDYMSLTAISGSTTVSGAPLNGNNFTFSGSNSGTITLAKTGSIANPNVGAKQAFLSEFKLTANTEAASIKRITMLQGGTLKPADLTNVKLKTGTSEWAGSVTSDGYVVFDLGSGFAISKGGSAVFRVYGDLAGKKDETIIFYFEASTDILGTGDQYGYGMAATITAMDTTGEAHTLTLQGGVLTINFVGPTASNISTNVTDVTLLRYTMTAATNIEVRKTKFTLCMDTGGNGTYNDAADTDSGWSDLTDFKVTDENTNTTVIGPQDGSAFTTSASNVCPNSATGAQKQFTDTLDLGPGKTYNYKVTADINTANADGNGVGLSASDKIKVVLGSYVEDTPDVTVMKYSGTNTAVADADIVPGAYMAGGELTLNSASLTLGLAATPTSQTYVRGVSGIDAVGMTFTSALSSPLKVTDITLSGYVADSGTTLTLGVGSGADANMKVSNLVSSVKLVEAESGATIAENPAQSNLNSATGTVVFNGLSWTIPAGSTRTVLARVNLSSNATSGSSDVFSFDIAATTDVTALDDSSNTVNPASVAKNGTTSPTVIMTVASSGSLQVAVAPDNPVSAAMYWGQTGVEAGKFRFTATNEGYYLETVRFQNDDSDTANDFKNNVKKVYMSYKNKAGNTLTDSQIPDSNTSVSFGWNSGDANRPYVPKGSSMDVTIKYDLKTKDEGATSNRNFSIEFNGSTGNTAGEFRAVGEGSGTVVTAYSANIEDKDTNNMYVYRVFPKFDSVALSSPYSLVGTPTVFKFTVTAMGLTDSKLLFDNQAVGSGSIKFEVVSSGEYSPSAASTQFTIYDENDTTVDSSTLTADSRASTDASLTFDFTTKDIEISGGQSKTFRIQLDNPNTSYSKTSETGRAADYFQVILRNNEAALINWVDNSTGSTGDADVPSTASVLKNLPIFGPTFQR